jgi:hypothetical protein
MGGQPIVPTPGPGNVQVPAPQMSSVPRRILDNCLAEGRKIIASSFELKNGVWNAQTIDGADVYVASFQMPLLSQGSVRLSTFASIILSWLMFTDDTMAIEVLNGNVPLRVPAQNGLGQQAGYIICPIVGAVQQLTVNVYDYDGNPSTENAIGVVSIGVSNYDVPPLSVNGGVGGGVIP